MVMGKRFAIAGLLGLMMASAFLLGIDPGRSEAYVSAASGGGGRVDMVNLLDSVLGLAKAPAESLRWVEPRNGMNVFVSEESVSANITAWAVPDGDVESFQFAAGGTWDGLKWVGEIYSELIVDAPYRAALDIQPLQQLAPNGAAPIYAFMEPTLAAHKEYTIEEPSVLSSVDVDYETAGAEYDVDNNGLPDQSFFDLAKFGGKQNGVWIADYGVGRKVAVADLDGPNSVTVSPDPGVFVTAPSLASLAAVGAAYAGYKAFLIVSVLDSYQAALDEYNGSTDPAGLNAWLPYGAQIDLYRVPGTKYVTVSLLAMNEASGEYYDIERLPGWLTVDVEMRGLAVPPTHNLVVTGMYPTRVAQTDAKAGGDLVFANVPDADMGDFVVVKTWGGDPLWYPADDPNIPEDRAFFSTKHLSLFGMFSVDDYMLLSLLGPPTPQVVKRIDAVEPDAGVAGETTETVIYCELGLDGPLTAEQASEAFEIYFGDLPGEVYGPGFVPTKAAGVLHVIAPAQDVAGPVTVMIVDRFNPDNFVMKADAFTYLARLTVNTTGGDGTVTVDPVAADNLYVAGTNVTLTAEPGTGFTFDHWEGDVTGTDNPASTTMDSSKTTTAVFALQTCTVTVNPAIGGTATLDPAGDPAGTYPYGTVVEATAVPELGYEFGHWEGDLAGSSNPEALTVDGNKTIQPVFTQLTYTVTLWPTEGGDIVLNPEGGTYTYGQNVSVTAVPAEGFQFDHWEGALTGSTNPENLTVDGNKNVGAVFTAIPPETRTITVLGAVGGNATLDPAGDPPGTFTVGQQVTITAVPLLGYLFDHWEGGLTGTENPAVVTVADNLVVQPVFALIPPVTWQLTLEASAGGSVAANPVGDPAGTYVDGTVVTLTATPDNNYQFDHWEVDLTGTTNPDTLTMDADKTVRGVFAELVVPGPTIESVAPGEAWLFGGVIAQIEGQNFVEDMTITVGGEEATVLYVDTTTAVFIVPPLPDPGDGQAEYVRNVVVARPDYQTANIAFTYRRFATSDNGVTTTAFYIDFSDWNPSTGYMNPIALALNGSLGFDNGGADLRFPPIAGAAEEPAFGLSRASKNPAAVLANEITAGQPVANVWDFGLHVYFDPEWASVEYNTQAIGSAVYREITNWTYPRTANARDVATLEFPVDDTALTAGNARAGISMWSRDTAFDYGTGATIPGDGGQMYQSTLLANEVAPPLTTTSADADALTSVAARLYDLSAFSLRTQTQATQLPPSITNGVGLDPNSDGEGPTTGGTPLTILCPNGGFGWVTLTFGNYPAKAYDLPASQFPAKATILNPGTNEYQIDLETPAYDTAETVDIGIYLKSDLSRPVVVLPQAFTYTKAWTPNLELWLTLIGLGVAIIGLAAGGSSGGGGGGPCFIATAAYGTPMATEIDALRSFRDTWLLDSAAGTAFVDAYYRVSPTLADAVAAHPALAAVVRVLLIPLVLAAKAPLAAATLFGSASLAFRWRRKRRVRP